MKETILLLARFNTFANGEMTKALRAADSGILTEDRGSFFRSIVGILNHILLSDFIWFNRFINNFPSIESLKNPLIPSDIQNSFENRYSSLDDWESIYPQVDKIFDDFANELDEGTLDKRFTYKNSKGEAFTVRLYDALLHLFNHPTHHRGQISQILDESGIENDFSGILRVLR